MAPKPTPRTPIRELPAYVPGRRAADKWKLSSNENPAPPSAAVMTAIADAAADVNRYPDMGLEEITQAIAAFHGVSPAQVAVGSGSIAVLEDLLQAYCEAGDEVVFPWRSFEAYPIAVQVTGATAVKVPLTPDARHDLPALRAAITDRTKVVLLCSPNNPTGPVLTQEEVHAFLDDVPRRVLVLLDEAYYEYRTQPDAVDGSTLVADYPNLVVLRTFSKAYGLPGLRVGYGLAHPDVVAAVRATSTAFAVNALAQRAAVAALADRATAMETVGQTVAERDRVLAAVRTAGWEVPDAQGNFFWLPLGRDALRFAADAEAAGFLVRAFAGDGVRITIGEKEANDAVIELLRTWH